VNPPITSCRPDITREHSGRADARRRPQRVACGLDTGGLGVALKEHPHGHRQHRHVHRPATPRANSTRLAKPMMRRRSTSVRADRRPDRWLGSPTCWSASCPGEPRLMTSTRYCLGIGSQSTPARSSNSPRSGTLNRPHQSTQSPPRRLIGSAIIAWKRQPERTDERDRVLSRHVGIRIERMGKNESSILQGRKGTPGYGGHNHWHGKQVTGLSQLNRYASVVNSLPVQIASTSVAHLPAPPRHGGRGR
jgi:hypothetical protein